MSEPAQDGSYSVSTGTGFVRLGLPFLGGQPPRTLQELATARDALCTEVGQGASAIALSPKAIWRYAWFEHRETHLIASLLAEPEALRICQQYAGALRIHAARMYAHPNPLLVRTGLFGAVVQSSRAFWYELRSRLCDPGSSPIGWPGRDADTWVWLQLCKLHVLVGTAPDGRLRSRRELGAIIAELDRQTNANTARLRLLPRVEQECVSGDGWAAGLGEP